MFIACNSISSKPFSKTAANITISRQYLLPEHLMLVHLWQINGTDFLKPCTYSTTVCLLKIINDQTISMTDNHGISKAEVNKKTKQNHSRDDSTYVKGLSVTVPLHCERLIANNGQNPPLHKYTDEVSSSRNRGGKQHHL